MKNTTKLTLATLISTLVFSMPVSAKVASKSVAKAPIKVTDKKSSKAASSKTVVKADKKKTAASSNLAKKTATKEVRVSAAKSTSVVKTKNGKKIAAPVVKAKGVSADKSSRKIVKTSYRAKNIIVAPKVAERPERIVREVRKPTSVARQYGLSGSYDPVGLNASVALVVDQNSWTTLYEKNVSTPLPIASITKLMTAMVVLDASQDLDEYITIDYEDVAHYAHSRLTMGTSLPRRDVMMLALMSSENRAAYALGRTYPGGMDAFVQAMNAKAAMLNMNSAQFVDPSGLSSSNQASAMDLAKMVNAATQYKTIRELSTNDSAYIYTADGNYKKYVNSNRLITRNMGWDIGLQKTGTLSAAGKCLVLQTRINGTPKIMVFLDSRSANSRVSDAVKLKDWIETGMTSNAAYQDNPTWNLPIPGS